MGFFDFLSDTVNGARKYLQESARENKEKCTSQLEQLIELRALSCNYCRCLAAPVYGSEAAYRCCNCGRQFTAKPHHIILKADALCRPYYPIQAGTGNTKYTGIHYEQALARFTAKHKR